MEQNITLQIDNHIVEVAKGTTILEAARGVGIQIPSLCYMNLKDMCITNLPGLPAVFVSSKSKDGETWLRPVLPVVKTA